MRAHFSQQGSEQSAQPQTLYARHCLGGKSGEAVKPGAMMDSSISTTSLTGAHHSSTQMFPGQCRCAHMKDPGCAAHALTPADSSAWLSDESAQASQQMQPHHPSQIPLDLAESCTCTRPSQRRISWSRTATRQACPGHARLGAHGWLMPSYKAHMACSYMLTRHTRQAQPHGRGLHLVPPHALVVGARGWEVGNGGPQGGIAHGGHVSRGDVVGAASQPGVRVNGASHMVDMPAGAMQ